MTCTCYTVPSVHDGSVVAADNDVLVYVLSAQCGRCVLYYGGFNCWNGCLADLFVLNTGVFLYVSS